VSLTALLETNLLSVVILLPVVAVLALWVLEIALRTFGGGVRVSEHVWKVYGLAVSIVGLLLALRVWERFEVSDVQSGMQLVERMPWMESLGIYYYVGVDGISLLLVVLTAFLLPVILLASWRGVEARIREYVFFMLALQTGMLGAFLSLNLFLFYVFWEVMLIPMYFIIGIWGGPRRIYATVKFFIYTMVGSLLMLVGILALVYMDYSATAIAGTSPTFDFIPFGDARGLIDVAVPAWPTGEPWWLQKQVWLFLAFAFAFAIKVPMFPFHTWLPDAHVEAPTPGSAVLAGVLLKMGTYGFIRFALPLFPEAAQACAPALLTLSVIGVVYGALVATVQTDVKKLVAYSSVSHLGLVMLGLFAFNLQGIEGSILQMVNHGISTGALFILVGMLYERRHVREISEFGGLASVMPVYAAAFLIATLSSIGLPMLNGFVGEFLILLGAFATWPLFTTVATLGVILGAVYMLWMMRRVFFGPIVHEVNSKLADLSLRERLVAASLIVPMLWIGLYPSTFLTPMTASVEALLGKMRTRGAVIEVLDPPFADVATALETTAARSPVDERAAWVVERVARAVDVEPQAAPRSGVAERATDLAAGGLGLADRSATGGDDG
jgi:NADH-quinone oxidoreductase subunit M